MTIQQGLTRWRMSLSFVHLCPLADLRLNQEVPLRPDMFQETKHVHCTLILDLLQHAVDHYVGACPSNTSTVTHMEY